MAGMIFVNLPVGNLDAATDFFAALGFEIDPDYSDDRAACVVLGRGVHAMLLTEDYFRSFISTDVADPWTTKEVVNCLTLESPEDVDAMVLDAIDAGGKEWLPGHLYPGGMYVKSFQDLDGHVWQLLAIEG